MTKSKKIISLILVLVVLAGVCVGAYFLFFKDASITDEKAEDAILSTIQEIDKTADMILESASGNQNLGANTNVTELDNIESLYNNVISGPGQYLSIIEYLIKNDKFAFDNVAYGDFAGDLIYTRFTKDKTGNITAKLYIPGESGSNGGGVMININYDYDKDRVNSFEMIGRMVDGDLSLSYINYNFSLNTIDALNFDAVETNYETIVEKVKNDYSLNYFIENLLGEYTNVFHAEVDFNDFNLSRWDGFSIDNDATANDISTIQAKILKDILTSLVNNFPTSDSISVEVKTEGALRSYAIDDSLDYMMSKYDYVKTTDANGNVIFERTLKAYDEQKTIINNLLAIANNTKPLYGNVSYNSAVLANGTKEINDAQFKGILNTLSLYLNSRTSENYCGLTGNYGSYEFWTAYGETEIFAESFVGELIDRNLLDAKNATTLEGYVVKLIHEFNNNKTYIQLFYQVDEQNNIVYFNYTSVPYLHENMKLTYYEYANVEGINYIAYENCTDFTITLNEDEISNISANDFSAIYYTNGYENPNENNYKEHKLTNDGKFEMLDITPTDTEINTTNHKVIDEFAVGDSTLLGLIENTDYFGLFQSRFK